MISSNTGRNTHAGKRVKKVRVKNKLTLEDLSQSCNLPLSYLKEVEDGRRELTSKALNYLAKNLDLDEDLEALHLSTSGMGDKIRALRDEKGLTLKLTREAKGITQKPKVQILIGHICTLDRGQLRLTLNFIQMGSGFLFILLSAAVLLFAPIQIGRASCRETV